MIDATDSLNNGILQLYSDGVSIEKMSRELGVCPATIRYRMKKLSLNSSKFIQTDDWVKGNEALFVYMLKSGASRKELSDRFMVCSEAIRKMIRKFGLFSDGRASKQYPKLSKDELSTYLSQGFNVAEISRLTGVQKATLSYWMRGYELETQPIKIPSYCCSFCKKTIIIDASATAKEISRHRAKASTVAKGGKTSCSAKCLHGLKRIASCEGLVKSRKSGTSIEVAIETTLLSLGIPYVSQKRIGFYTVDFYLPDSMTVIECYGTFHHADPRKYTSDNFYETQKHCVSRDKRRNTYLGNRGYSTIILWQNEIDNDIPWCTQQITEIHEARKGAASDMSLFCAAL